VGETEGKGEKGVWEGVGGGGGGGRGCQCNFDVSCMVCEGICDKTHLCVARCSALQCTAECCSVLQVCRGKVDMTDS